MGLNIGNDAISLIHEIADEALQSKRIDEDTKAALLIINCAVQLHLNAVVEDAPKGSSEGYRTYAIEQINLLVAHKKPELNK